MVALQVIVTSFLTLSILVGSPEHRIRDQCLGNYMIHYTRYFFLFLTFSSLNLINGKIKFSNIYTFNKKEH